MSDGNLFYDSCLGSDADGNQILVQVDCTDEADPKYGYSYTTVTTTCPRDRPRCFEGVCLGEGPTCTDSDEGDDPFVIGEGTYLGEHVTDRCQDEESVEQIRCSEGNLTFTPSRCSEAIPDGICADGACVPRLVCREPSLEDRCPGSTVTEISGRRHIDTCVGPTTVRHVVCSEEGQPTVVQTECLSDRTCLNGLCGRQPHCHDQDPDNDVHTETAAGDVHEVDGMSYDRCSERNPRVVLEMVCIEGSREELPVRCPDGEVCSQGRCMETSCEDSDPEDSPVVSGRATQPMPEGYSVEKQDLCRIFFWEDEAIPEGEVTIEARCDRFGRATHRAPSGDFDQTQDGSLNLVDCPEGLWCIGGVCRNDLVPECHETDGGNDPLVRGIVTSNRQTTAEEWAFDDRCVSDSAVQEYWCGANGYVRGGRVDCPAERFCFLGACVTCGDTDPENDPYLVGTVRVHSRRDHSDFCRGDRLIQLDCSPDGTMVERETRCPFGQRCRNGRCDVDPPEQGDRSDGDPSEEGLGEASPDLPRERWCGGEAR